MPLNVKISFCKITRASKLFARNYYLPLFKPLSPKDALRRKIITGQNVLGSRIEHYIPVLQPYDEKISEKRRRPKGVPVIKKRVRKRDTERYVEPAFDDNNHSHLLLQNLLRRKPKGKGQHYIYEVPDKTCTLVINSQLERALKDKDIVDITMAQRSEKICLKLNNGSKVTIPVQPFESHVPLYRGSGWSRRFVENEHHHGKETMSIAKLFEAKEQGVEEWELEMMRLASKKQKKKKGGADAGDWKQMLAGKLDEMDWDKMSEDDEDEKKDENIPMEVNDMEKTTNVAEKLMAGGQEVLDRLPVVKEIPEIIKNLESGTMNELMNVSGVDLTLPSNGKNCFVTGQMVKNDEEVETFVPGQTIVNEEGNFDYTPGITVYEEGQVQLIKGLVMGEEESDAMFLPGESTITEQGQLKFDAPPPPEPEPEEEEFMKRRRMREQMSESPPPQPTKPKPRKQYDEEIVIKRRVINEPEPEKKEKVKKRAPIELKKEPSPVREKVHHEPIQMDDSLLVLEQERMKREEEERKRMRQRAEEKKLKDENRVDQLRLEMRKKLKQMKFEKPHYEPIAPVVKSQRLEELEQSIKKGTFFDDDKTKEILERAKSATRLLKYEHVLNAYGNDFGIRRF